MIEPRLENWSFIVRSGDPYTAPELISGQLAGNVYNHPRFKDGEPVVTSLVVKEENGKVVTYSGSRYELGEPNPAYEQQFPDAKNRLMKALKGE